MCLLVFDRPGRWQEKGIERQGFNNEVVIKDTFDEEENMDKELRYGILRSDAVWSVDSMLSQIADIVEMGESVKMTVQEMIDYAIDTFENMGDDWTKEEVGLAKQIIFDRVIEMTGADKIKVGVYSQKG